MGPNLGTWRKREFCLWHLWSRIIFPSVTQEWSKLRRNLGFSLYLKHISIKGVWSKKLSSYSSFTIGPCFYNTTETLDNSSIQNSRYVCSSALGVRLWEILTLEFTAYHVKCLAPPRFGCLTKNFLKTQM